MNQYDPKLIKEIIERTASAIHHDWYQEYPKTKNGKVGSIWKQIKSTKFISKLNPEKLPKNIKYTPEGKYMMDVANSEYSELSFDLQMEAREASKVATKLALQTKGASLTEHVLEEIGETIQKSWLDRNTWAKKFKDLNKTYDELNEKDRYHVIKQYLNASKVVQELVPDMDR